MWNYPNSTSVLVSNSHKGRQLGGESRRRLHLGDDMIWKRIYGTNEVNPINTGQNVW